MNQNIFFKESFKSDNFYLLATSFAAIVSLINLSFAQQNNVVNQPSEKKLANPELNSTILNSDNNRKPNIVYILADDMGYGDVSALNNKSKITTPNIDRMADDGIIFIDAHASAAVCTPSRYSILTGRYPWRTTMKKGVLHGYSQHLIEPTRLTVASFLKNNGYNTASVGKWHLGLDWNLKEGDTANKDFSNVDFTKPFTNGPTTVGFDYFFGIAASLDMPPYVYLENNRVVDVPTEIFQKQGIIREGPKSKKFEFKNVLKDFTDKAIEYIDNQTVDKPFFLYFPLNAPHTPIVPTEEFVDKSGATKYGDYCLEVDWTIGEILKVLEKKGFDKNTILIFTSDNGFAPYVLNEYNMESIGHKPSYIFRGYKADIWEGGHRIPFILKWPKVVKPSSISNQTICQSDLLATVADILEKNLPDNAGEDSYSILPILKNPMLSLSVRKYTVHQSSDGMLALRMGKWKLKMCAGSGRTNKGTFGEEEALKLKYNKIQLYDFESDVSETKDVSLTNPEIVEKLKMGEVHLEKNRIMTELNIGNNCFG